MQKIINKYIKPISILLIVIGISCVFWSVINIKSYSTFNTKKEEKNNISIYKSYPSTGDYIGTINIPILDKTFPIYEGTGTEELKKGVGHFIDSVLPGVQDNSVLSAHRDTLFNEIWKLKTGDKIIINMDSEEFVYEVINTRIVNKNDRTVIVPTKDAILTLTTCYPFNYIGTTSERYIVSSILIND